MSAVISGCGRYRYRLERVLKESNTIAPVVAFIMVNPSTADAEHNDPTIRRCIGFADRLGARLLLVGNLFAYRATDVRVLGELCSQTRAIGDDNNWHLSNIMKEADPLYLRADAPVTEWKVPWFPGRGI